MVKGFFFFGGGVGGKREYSNHQAQQQKEQSQLYCTEVSMERFTLNQDECANR